MWELLIPSFIAGVLMFLAPCTLPLVPSYLGFISGVSLTPENLRNSKIQRRILFNSFLYVVGFSLVFIVIGSAFSWGGSWLAPHRLLIARLGGIFIIFFGLFMLHAFNLPWLKFLYREKHLPILKHLVPGRPTSSFIFGATFAFGWTPCIGPILATVLFLTASTASFWSGISLLLVFSLGMSLPFMLLGAAAEYLLKFLPRLVKVLPIISTIGGLFLIMIGFLLLTNTLGFFAGWFNNLFSFIDYENLLKYY